LLASLSVQTYHNFDVTLVDQNPDDRIVAVIDRYVGKFPIVHTTSERGASRARNAGILVSTGDVVVFPDDDCWYPSDLLERVAKQLHDNPQIDGITGRPFGDDYWDSIPGRIDRFNVFKRGIEYTMFLRRKLVNQVGLFDEDLGPGSGTSFWAGEGADYLLRSLENDFVLQYFPDVQVNHPKSIVPNDDPKIHAKKSYHYALAKGRVLSQRDLPPWFVAYQCFRPVVGAGYAMLRADIRQASLYWTVARGLMEGAVSEAPLN
jgi:glycosyltransferase involved in cell wall biosynthesis